MCAIRHWSFTDTMVRDAEVNDSGKSLTDTNTCCRVMCLLVLRSYTSVVTDTMMPVSSQLSSNRDTLKPNEPKIMKSVSNTQLQIQMSFCSSTWGVDSGKRLKVWCSRKGCHECSCSGIHTAGGRH